MCAINTVWAGGSEYSYQSGFQAASVTSLYRRWKKMHTFCFCMRIWAGSCIKMYLLRRCSATLCGNIYIGNCGVKYWWIYQPLAARMGESRFIMQVFFRAVPEMYVYRFKHTHTRTETQILKLDFYIDRGRL